MWPNTNIAPNAGGHTHQHGRVSGSEFYKYQWVDGHQKLLNPQSCMIMVGHEAMHNLLPGWTTADLHANGGGGIALSHPQLPMTDKNRELLRRGFSVKTPQLL
jgi:hypothetical protein